MVRDVVILPIEPPALQLVNQRLLAPTPVMRVRPATRAAWKLVTACVEGSTLPMDDAPWFVNQRAPSGPAVIPSGSPMLGAVKPSELAPSGVRYPSEFVPGGLGTMPVDPVVNQR